MSSQDERRVHGARLADAIDATDALLDPRGCPGQLEAHDPSSPVLEVQSLAGDIRREKHRRVAAPKAGRWRRRARRPTGRRGARRPVAGRASVRSIAFLIASSECRNSVKIRTGSRVRSSSRRTRRTLLSLSDRGRRRAPATVAAMSARRQQTVPTRPSGPRNRHRLCHRLDPRARAEAGSIRRDPRSPGDPAEATFQRHVERRHRRQRALAKD